jgi:alpha-mannosidase
MRFSPAAPAGAAVTVHLVFNAHIDPVWLWPWEQGIDEALATCRSACDRLDANPDLVFSQGEAWVYDVVERLDPELFGRIAAHVAAERWEIVGGWWIQPDCNLPSAAGVARQIELGRDYFLSRFGRFPRVACNVDSFGHAAALPRLMHSRGQDRYVMMRPQEHELELPARLFRWRTGEHDPEVVTFRIARNYEISQITPEHVLASLEGLPEGVRHTMCFVGVGDHGGGPTERQIRWCRDHAHAFDGCELAFSSPGRFFDAVASDAAALPLVTGELQHHAVGCYSVIRSIKTAVRDAEHRLGQAEIVLEADPRPDADAGERLRDAWRHVCFNHFHDTLGGACIPSAYPQLLAQVGAAATAADEIVQFGFRRRLPALPDHSRQRIVLLNASDEAFDGWLTLAPWTEQPWEPHWRILDPAGAPVPHQVIEQEALARHTPRLVAPARLAARELKLLTISRDPPAADEPAPPAPSDPARIEAGELVQGRVGVAFAPGPVLRLGSLELRPRLALIEDTTGTWAHEVERFGEATSDTVAWSPPEPVHGGPLMCSAVQSGVIGRSGLMADWRLHADEGLVRMELRVDWRARHRVLKLVLPFDEEIEGRIDGVMGGALDRGTERRERPMRDVCLVRLRSGAQLGIVCPDVFAVDSDARSLRLTLLRSPFMAHHHPSHPATPPHGVIADQGPHSFRFEFLASHALDIATLERRALMRHRPPLVSDWTKGMPARSGL